MVLCIWFRLRLHCEDSTLMDKVGEGQLIIGGLLLYSHVNVRINLLTYRILDWNFF